MYTLGRPRVRAGDLPSPPDVGSLDTHRYIELLMRAVETVLTPFGFSRRELDEWVIDNVRSMPLWSYELSVQGQQPIDYRSLFNANFLQVE